MNVLSYLGYSDPNSVHNFLLESEVYQTSLGVLKEAMLWQVVPIALVGDTAHWLRLQRRFETPSEFQSRFREEFVHSAYHRRVREELSLRSQHPEETLVEYVHAVQELYERADLNATDSQKASLAIQQCHPVFRPHLCGRNFANLEALVWEAHIVQADLLAELGYEPSLRPEESVEPSCTWSGFRC